MKSQLPMVNSVFSCLADYTTESTAIPLRKSRLRFATVTVLAASLGTIGMLLNPNQAVARSTVALPLSAIAPAHESNQQLKSSEVQLSLAATAQKTTQASAQSSDYQVEIGTPLLIYPEQASPLPIAQVGKEANLFPTQNHWHQKQQSNQKLLRHFTTESLLRVGQTGVTESKVEQPKLTFYRSVLPVAVNLNKQLPSLKPEASLTPLEIEPFEQVSLATSPVELFANQESPQNRKELKTNPPKSEVSTTSQEYQVKSGDNLETIARSYGVSASVVIKANAIRDPDLIKVNQKLTIPQSEAPKTRPSSAVSATPTLIPYGGSYPDLELANRNSEHSQSSKLKAEVTRLQREYRIRGSQNSTDISRHSVNSSGLIRDEDSQQSKIESIPKSNQSEEQSQAVETNATAVPIKLENYYSRIQPLEEEVLEPQLPPLSSPEQYLPDSPSEFNGFIWPAKGVLTSGYGRRWGRMHRGIDVAGPVGTPIVAAASGEVITAGWSSGGYGNLVKVKHPDGSLTVYAHNSRILVNKGQKVEQGQQIAEMGSTGYSTGPHLHFELHPHGGGAANPMAYLPKQR